LNFSLYIAKRYLISKSSNSTINIITIIASVGVCLGALALFVVLSVFSGLKTFNINFISVSNPDLKIIPKQGKTFIFNDSIANKLRIKGVETYSKVVEERAFFNYQQKSKIAILKGVGVNYPQVVKIDTTVYVGKWFTNNNQVVVGNRFSQLLSIGVEDYLESLKIYVPKPGKGYILNPKNAFNEIVVQPVGIFSITEDVDANYVFTSLQTVQNLLSFKPNQISYLSLKLKPFADENEIASNLSKSLGNRFWVKTKQQQNAVFYKMLNTENLVSYLIFTLVVIIALFNVAGSVVMMILDKKDNLKTLYNLGASIKEIRYIFVLQGFLLTSFGAFIGLALGVLIVFLQRQFSLFMITSTLPYPIEFRWLNLIVVIITILSLGYLASKIVSNRITKKTFE